MEQMAPASQPSFEATPAFEEPPPPPAAPEPSPWDEPQQDDASTRAIPKMSFEEMRQMAEAAQPSEPPPFETLGAPAEPEASPWDEAPTAFGGETRVSADEFRGDGADGVGLRVERTGLGSADRSVRRGAARAETESESPFAAEETPVNADTAVNNQITDDVEPADH